MICNIQNFDAINKASNIIDKGGVIIYPTDTLYGLGVDATNTNAIKKLNDIKKREQVYSIIVNSLVMLKKYAVITDSSMKIIKECLPGPFTVILNKKKSDLSNLVSLKLNTVGIRIPEHNFPLEIVKSLNRPIITTSVNIHGQKSLHDLNNISKNFNKINIFSDDSLNKNSKGSTIIDCTKSKIKILRNGDGIYTS